jgi:hypothetical protein
VRTPESASCHDRKQINAIRSEVRLMPMVQTVRHTSEIRHPSRTWLARWVALVPLAFLNGALRAGYERFTGENAGHQISGVVLVSLVLWWANRTAGRYPLDSAGEALAVGSAWAAMTVVFEFGFFHYVGDQSWADIAADYDLTDGRTWGLVVLGIALAPYVVARTRGDLDR